MIRPTSRLKKPGIVVTVNDCVNGRVEEDRIRSLQVTSVLHKGFQLLGLSQLVGHQPHRQRGGWAHMTAIMDSGAVESVALLNFAKSVLSENRRGPTEVKCTMGQQE